MMSINEESNADASSIGGRVANEMILIQRYQRLEFNVVAALCNAVQEPGEIILIVCYKLSSPKHYIMYLCVLHYSQDLYITVIWCEMRTGGTFIAS